MEEMQVEGKLLTLKAADATTWVRQNREWLAATARRRGKASAKVRRLRLYGADFAPLERSRSPSRSGRTNAAGTRSRANDGPAPAISARASYIAEVCPYSAGRKIATD